MKNKSVVTVVLAVVVCFAIVGAFFLGRSSVKPEKQPVIPTATVQATTAVPREASEMFQFIRYEDKRDVFGFKVHSFSTFDKIKKYDEADTSKSVDKPYFTEVGKTKRTINLYVVASAKFQIAC